MPITKNMSIADVIKDFVNSTDKRFDGKSKDERIKMAKGAFYAMQSESILNDDLPITDLDRLTQRENSETVMTTEKLLVQIVEKSEDAKETLGEIFAQKMAVKIEELRKNVMKSDHGI